MKNLRLLTLIAACCLFSFSSFAQSFTNYGTYSGTMTNGSTIKITLDASDVATMEINEIPQGIVAFAYQPVISDIIKFKAIPVALSVGEVLPVPTFRNGLFEPINATEWRLQLNAIGQPAPNQFDANQIILEFTPN